MDETRIDLEQDVHVVGAQVVDAGPLVVQAEVDVHGHVASMPEVAHGTAYCSILQSRGLRHVVVAVDLHSGDVAWQVPVGGWSHVNPLSPLAYRDVLFVAVDAGTVVCLSRQNGDAVWIEQVCPGLQDGRMMSPMTMAGSVLLVGAHTGELVALDATTGKRLWRCSCPEGTVRSKPVVWRDNVLFCTWIPRLQRTYLHCASLETGQEQWWLDVGATANDNHANPLLVDDVLFLPGQAGYVHGVDLATRQLCWTTDVDSPTHTPVRLGGVLYCRCDTRQSISGFVLHSEGSLFPDCVLELQTECLEPYELSVHDGRIYCPSGSWLFVLRSHPAEGVPTEYGARKYRAPYDADCETPHLFVTGLAHDGDLFCAGLAGNKLLIGRLPDVAASDESHSR